MPRKVMIVGLIIKNIESVVADPKGGGSCPNNFRQINLGCLHGLWGRFRVLATGGLGYWLEPARHPVEPVEPVGHVSNTL